MYLSCISCNEVTIYGILFHSKCVNLQRPFHSTDKINLPITYECYQNRSHFSCNTKTQLKIHQQVGRKTLGGDTKVKNKIL